MPRHPAPPTPFQPIELLRITAPEQLKAISDPLRLEMLELVAEEARTVKQIAELLGKPATKLYYHMNALEAAGFVKVVETRVKSGIIEKYYRTVAESFQVDRKLLKRSGPQGDEPLENMLAVVFDATTDDVRRSWAAGLLPLGATAKKLRERVVLTRSLYTVPEADIPKFTAKFNALLKELHAAETPEGTPYGLTLAFYPRALKTPKRKTP